MIGQEVSNLLKQHAFLPSRSVTSCFLLEESLCVWIMWSNGVLYPLRHWGFAWLAMPPVLVSPSSSWILPGLWHPCTCECGRLDVRSIPSGTSAKSGVADELVSFLNAFALNDCMFTLLHFCLHNYVLDFLKHYGLFENGTVFFLDFLLVLWGVGWNFNRRSEHENILARKCLPLCVLGFTCSQSALQRGAKCWS